MVNSVRGVLHVTMGTDLPSEGFTMYYYPMRCWNWPPIGVKSFWRQDIFEMAATASYLVLLKL
jgi:hypothetical protein